MRPLSLIFLLAMQANAQNYQLSHFEQDGAEVYELADLKRALKVRVAPAFGNNAYWFEANGKQVLWAPQGTLRELMARRAFGGNPLLWPWANRLDQEAFYANGKKYVLNPELGNYRRDGNRQPIHGLVSYATEWRVVRGEADSRQASVRSRLEFWRVPGWMAQFPFAHTVEMTYRLRDGALEVETSVENHSSEPLPLSLGFHPYFQLHDVPRDEWRVTLPARERVLLTPKLVPSGELAPNPWPQPVPLAGLALDDVFSGLVRGADGLAVFRIEGKAQSITVECGPQYPVAVVYAPPGRNFICFEPMTAITNALNAAQAGWYKHLPSVAPGETWTGVYRIRPAGF